MKKKNKEFKYKKNIAWEKSYKVQPYKYFLNVSYKRLKTLLCGENQLYFFLFAQPTKEGF